MIKEISVQKNSLFFAKRWVKMIKKWYYSKDIDSYAHLGDKKIKKSN